MTVVDVGSGQGYLAQALSFEYQLPVVAIMLRHITHQLQTLVQRE